MQHKSYLVPVTSPNTKLSGVQSLTFLPPAVHLTAMTFIFALVSKNSNGLGFLHSDLSRIIEKPVLSSSAWVWDASEWAWETAIPQPSLTRAPNSPEAFKCFGTALGCSTAPYFWPSALLTWNQFYAFSAAVGFCLGSEKHGWRAFLTLWTCSHSYRS